MQQETARPRMRAVRVLEELLDEYIETVERSPMTERSKYTYITQADMFVRWVKGEFEPGETLW
jgi:hypothetical protein